MSNNPPIMPTPFIINKSIMKYPLRSDISKPQAQPHQRNISVFINKKYAEFHPQLEESPKARLIQDLQEKLVDKHALKVRALRQSLDNLDEKNTGESLMMRSPKKKARKPSELPLEYQDVIPTKSMSPRKSSHDIKLRSWIYNSLTPRTLKRIYDSYKGKLVQAKVSKIKEGERIALDDLFKINNGPLNRIEDVYLTQVLESEKFDAIKALGVDGNFVK